MINLQKDNYLEDVDIDRLFANIKEVYDTNFTFWEDYLKHVTEEARQTKLPIKPSQLHDSFACVSKVVISTFPVRLIQPLCDDQLQINVIKVSFRHKIIDYNSEDGHYRNASINGFTIKKYLFFCLD